MSAIRALGEVERLVLMAIMRLGSGAYGVAIRQEIEYRAERPVSLGTVYAALSRLSENGYISARMGEPTAARGGRAKRYYKIEAPGVEALNRNLASIEKLKIWQPEAV